MGSSNDNDFDWGCLMPFVVVAVIMLILVGATTFAEYSYTSSRSPLKAEWDLMCPGVRCENTAQCNYIKEWVWKDTVCWTGYGYKQECTSIFSSPEFDILVGGTTTKLSGGFYIYNKVGSQPYTMIRGPVDHCPSEKYPEK